MSRVGYTPKQAQRQKDRLDRQMATAETAVTRFASIVPDTPILAEIQGPLEELREMVHNLKAVIDRRTNA